MRGRLIGLSPQRAEALVRRAKGMQWSARGIDRRAYLIDDIAVLRTDRLKLRNVTTRDDDLKHLDAIIDTLAELHDGGTAVLPILGYCLEDEGGDGAGFLFQQRAKGREVYDDAVLTKYQVWAQGAGGGTYLKTPLSDAEAKEYLLSRTAGIASAPQEHFDKFARDVLRVLEKDILIDCNGKSNFFYDDAAGFQLIDLDAHNDFYYGLTDKRADIGRVACFCVFALCHFAPGTRLFAPGAMDAGAMGRFGSGIERLKQDNAKVYQKCLSALRNGGVPEGCIRQATGEVRILGVRSDEGGISK